MTEGHGILRILGDGTGTARARSEERPFGDRLRVYISVPLLSLSQIDPFLLMQDTEDPFPDYDDLFTDISTSLIEAELAVLGFRHSLLVTDLSRYWLKSSGRFSSYLFRPDA